VGEVWLGSGQSNMAMTVAGCTTLMPRRRRRSSRSSATTAKARAPPTHRGRGQRLVAGICTPDTVGGFSATLYFFGREIHREVGVPVGLINTSVGGTPIESWVAAEVQSSDPENEGELRHAARSLFEVRSRAGPRLHEKQLAIWKRRSEKAKANGTPFVVPPPKDPAGHAQAQRRGPPVSSMARSSISHPTRCVACCGIKAKAMPTAIRASTTSSSRSSSRVGARFGRMNCPSRGCSCRTSPRPAKAGRACVNPC
jgi:hypothetical protein